MPKYQYTDRKPVEFELLKNGDYPFEIVGYDCDISKGAKTNGCDQVTLKVKFFTDTTFKKPIAQWSERFQFPPAPTRDTSDAIESKLNAFKECANMQGKLGEDVEFSEQTTIGLRGIARVRQEKRSDTGELKNSVAYWLIDKEKFPQVVKPVEEEERPF